ncbi:MAG: NUDIX domain-containing protein [Bacteroidia bacterium]|nr:NUDIX domain-containing protein [Bacteroidia bacterium]
MIVSGIEKKVRTGQVQAAVLCLLRKNDQLLVTEGYDRIREMTYYRPICGNLEFGEYSWEAARRILHQYVGHETQELSFIGPVESILTLEEQSVHELFFVFEVMSGHRDTHRSPLAHETNLPARAVWKSIQDFRRGQLVLYPEGLLDMLITGS